MVTSGRKQNTPEGLPKKSKTGIVGAVTGVVMPILWTFENREKLASFREVLVNSDIPFDVVSKNGKIDDVNGLIVTVGDYEYKRAKKLLLRYRKRKSNRNNK